MSSSPPSDAPGTNKSSSEILNELFSTFNSSFAPTSPKKSAKKKKKKHSKSRSPSPSSSSVTLKKSKKHAKLLDLKKEKKKSKKDVSADAKKIKRKKLKAGLTSPTKSKKKSLSSSKKISVSSSSSNRHVIGDGFVILKQSSSGASPRDLEDGEIMDDDNNREKKLKKKKRPFEESMKASSSTGKKPKLSASQAYKLDAEERILLGCGDGHADKRYHHSSSSKSTSRTFSAPSSSSSKSETSSSHHSSRRDSRRSRSPPSSSSIPRLAPPRESYRSSYLKFEKERDHFSNSNSGSSRQSSSNRNYDSASYYDYHSQRGRSSYSSSRGGFGYVGKSYYYEDVDEEENAKRRYERNSGSSSSRYSSSSSSSSWRHRRRSPPSPRRSYYHPDDIIDKSELLEIARKNAKKLMRSGVLPSDIFSRDQILAIKAGGKSVEELTIYCKKLARRDAAGDARGSSDESDADGGRGDFIHHPFQVKDKPLPTITLNIRNAVPLPVRTPHELAIESAKLRTQFPVSSGTQHRFKELEWKPVSDTDAKKDGETTSTALVPLGNEEPSTSSSLASGPNVATVAPMVRETEEDKKDATKEDEVTEVTEPEKKDDGGKLLALMGSDSSDDSNNSKTKSKSKEEQGSGISVDGPDLPLVDISSVIGLRLKAMRLLQENPTSGAAQRQLDEATQMMKHWADAKALEPKFLTPAELSSGPQAWAKKDQLRKTRALDSGMGMHLLQKMGWRPGEGLGKNKEGQLEPLALDVKTDKKGLTAAVEDLIYGKSGGKGASGGSGPSMPVVYDLSGKHPVSALMELTAKRRWGAPEFQICFECGPPHKKQFVYKVIVNGIEYQPCVAVGNKKQAKANAAAFCLQSLGLLPTMLGEGGDDVSGSGAELLQTVGDGGVKEPVSNTSTFVGGGNEGSKSAAANKAEKELMPPPPPPMVPPPLLQWLKK